MYTSLTLQAPKQILHLIPRKRRQHLPQLPQRTPFFPVILNMLQQQLLVRLAVQTTLARVDPRITDVPVESPGQQQPCTPPASHAFDDPPFQQRLDPGFKVVGNWLFAVDEIDQQ